MALFPNQNYEGNIGKSHTNLFVSEGNAPAEQFMVSRTNEAEPFHYEYGPEGNQLVKLAKGKIVEAVGEEMNRQTGFTETAIRQAPEDSLRAIGVNHHNISEATGRARGGDFNRPTVLTRAYVEVPLFEASDIENAKASAKAMHFGATYATENGIKSGDFVGVGADGNFKVLSTVTDPRAIVGQVLNVNRNVPPAGLLQYYTGLTNSDQIESYLQSLAPTGVEYPYGTSYSVGSWRADFLKQLGYGNLTGIPFLTDGYFSSLETVTVTLDDAENIEKVAGSSNVEIAGATVTVGEEEADGTLFIKLAHKLDRRNLQNIEVSYTNEETPVKVSAADLNVDVNNNTLVVYLDQGTYTDITVTAEVAVNPTAGIPTEWDYKGSVGAVRILLQR